MPGHAGQVLRLLHAHLAADVARGAVPGERGPVLYARAHSAHACSCIAQLSSWTVRFTDIVIKGKKMGMCPPAGCLANFDPAMMMNTAPVDYHHVLVAQGEATISCIGKDQLPVTTIMFAERNFTLVPDDLSRKVGPAGGSMLHVGADDIRGAVPVPVLGRLGLHNDLAIST
jgi:hypothetical protein